MESMTSLRPEPCFLEGFREVTERQRIVLVFDEMLTGFPLAAVEVILRQRAAADPAAALGGIGAEVVKDVDAAWSGTSKRLLAFPGHPS